MARRYRRLASPLCLLPLVACLPAWAGTLRTLDGQTYEGALKLEPTGHVSIVPATGPSPQPVALDDILYADFRTPEAPKPVVRPPPPPRATDAAGDLPAGWRGGAVGTLAEPPYAKFQGGAFSLKSAGGEVGGTRDACTFLQQPVGPDADLVACLKDTASGQVVTGVTIRAGSAADAPHVSLFYFGDDIRFLRRTHAGRATDGGPVGGRVNLPIWMRLTRRGDTVTTSLSKDGQSWEEVGQATFTPVQGVTVLAGLAVFNPREQLGGAHYTNVRLSTAPAPREDAAIPAAATASSSAAVATPLKPSALKRGLMLRSGTLIANADVYRADDGTVHYTKAGRGETISMVNVARILMRDLTPQAAAKIPEKGAGLLLKEGDFVDGDFKSLVSNRVSLSSVLFGLKTFDARDKLAAIVINDPEPGRPAAIVRTTDGSTYVAAKLSTDKTHLILEEPLVGPVTLDRGDVAELSIGPARLNPLAGRAPEKIEPEGALVRADSAAGGSLTLPAGAAATWPLAGQYRTFTATCAVPASVLPTVPLRFIVLADDKEIFRSPPRTSLNDPLPVTLNVKGAKSLTLRTGSTIPTPIPVPGVWTDPSLIR